MGMDLWDAEREAISSCFSKGVANLDGGTVRAAVLRGLFLRSGSFPGGQLGRLEFENGKVLGDLDLSALALDLALRFTGIELELLRLVDTRIVALELEGGSAARIEADRIEVGHDLVMSGGFSCNGGTLMRSASVGGDLNCDGACLLGAPDGASILLDGARIGSRLYFRWGFRADHGVLVRNARVAGGILCTEAIFESEVEFTRTQIEGELSFREASIGKAHANAEDKSGRLLLDSMHVKGKLNLLGTAYHGHKIDLRGTTVDGSVLWTLQRPKPRAPKLVVDLTQAHFGYLHDDLDCWHDAKVLLDGFSLDGVTASGKNWLENRKKWLKSQSSDEWSPRPYDQVRAALRDSGDENKAREIAIERERVRCKRGGLEAPAQLAHGIYGFLLAYGYKPFRIVWISAAIVLALWPLFATVDSCQLPTAAAQCGGFDTPGASAPPFHALLFSLDAFLPIDLGQISSWRPREPFFVYLVAAETTVGWIFAALLLGAVTGVLRRD